MKAIFFVLIFLSPQIYGKVETSIGAFYSSNRVYRGALIWDAPVAAVGPAFVFNGVLAFGPGGLSLFKELAGGHKFSLGHTYFDDGAPDAPVIKLKGSKEDFKNQRRSTQGFYFKHEYRPNRKFRLEWELHRDVQRHRGSYLRLQAGSSITPFFRYGAGAGAGDANHNLYVYGEGAREGVGHIDYYAGLFLPFLPKQGILMVNYNYTEIAQTENINADYIRGLKVNRSLSMIALWKL